MNSHEAGSTLNTCLELLDRIFREADWDFDVRPGEILATLRVNFIRLLPALLEEGYLDDYDGCRHEEVTLVQDGPFWVWWCPICGGMNLEAEEGSDGKHKPRSTTWNIPRYFPKLEEYRGDRDTAIEMSIKDAKERALVGRTLRAIHILMGPYQDAKGEWSIKLEPVVPLLALLGLGKEIPLPKEGHQWSELIAQAREAFEKLKT